MYIFDIDGTLADCEHRLHYILDTPKDWRAFFAACKDDKPILDVAKLARILNDYGHRLFIITGRSDECEDTTMDWLRENNIKYVCMYMRKAGDPRQDNIVKGELLDHLIDDWDDEIIEGVFEDRQQVVDMYRARGLRVYQVARGDF